VDPGIKTAFAALDLRGNLVASGTMKEADADRIVEEVSRLGVPSLVASDVNPAPAFVQKIAARFNVRTFTPQRSMLEEEKREIAPSAQNLHERDATAAAVKCYRAYANRLRQIELLETAHDRDTLKHLVIQGFSLNNAMLRLERKPERRHAHQNPREAKKDKENGEINRLAEENVNLRKALDAHEKRIAGLEEELRKTRSQRHFDMMKDREVKILRSELRSMGWKLAKFRKRLSGP